jgi:ubiquinone/menaquinone biosynthesis C-methylase UbiE
LTQQGAREGWKGWLESLEGELEDPTAEHLLVGVADRIIEGARLSPGDTVLDLGAGTGLLTFRAAKAVGAGGKVSALDESAECLDSIVREAARAGIDNVVTVEGRLESLPFGPGEFDAVVCRSALVYAEDLDSAAAELVRVLAPGGRFSVFEPLAGEMSWTGDVRKGFLELERLLKESGGPRAVDREMLRSAFEKAGPGRLESLVVHFRVSMEGRPVEDVADEYLFDLPGDLGALYVLRGSLPETKIKRAVDAFAEAASAGELKGTLPCLFIKGTAGS